MCLCTVHCAEGEFKQYYVTSLLIPLLFISKRLAGRFKKMLTMLKCEVVSAFSAKSVIWRIRGSFALELIGGGFGTQGYLKRLV